jgi:hypothetical protein
MDVFFYTEEAHAVMLAYAADRGGRAALKVIPTSLDLDFLGGSRCPPGSSEKSRLKVVAQFGAKKDIHIPHHCQVKQNRCVSLLCGAKAIIDSTVFLYP